jgi:hypothetical protein
MAQSKAGKPRRATGRAIRTSEKEKAPGRGRASRPTSLERERDELRAELEAARQRITALEAQRSQAIDRIDWVIDSLQHMVESGP